MYNYVETLHELIEIFYFYKNETLDLISDDELIKFMKNSFDGKCQGSLELLSGRERNLIKWLVIYDMDMLLNIQRIMNVKRRMKIMNIEKRHFINSHNLSGEFYFNTILQEAYTCGLLNESDLENIQLQCINLLSYKSERYNMGKSSSIRVETAESIMESNFYSIGLYLKSLPDPDYAVNELKTVKISELYERGIKLVNTRFQVAKCIYNMVQNNKLDTLNHSYNSTLSENGIGIFFKSFNLEYEAHDSPASIDYQLCNPVNDLAGVEFIQKYLENLYLENEFCMNFATDNIIIYFMDMIKDTLNY